MLVGSLPFEPFEGPTSGAWMDTFYESTLVGFVRAETMGVQPSKPEEFRGEPGDKSYVTGDWLGPIPDPYGKASIGDATGISDIDERVGAWVLPTWRRCEPILFADRSRWGSQYVDGVELSGWSNSFPGGLDSNPRYATNPNNPALRKLASRKSTKLDRSR